MREYSINRKLESWWMKTYPTWKETLRRVLIFTYYFRNREIVSEKIKRYKYVYIYIIRIQPENTTSLKTC